MNARTQEQQASNVEKGETDTTVIDTRFRALLGEEAWSVLPVEVQQRFSKRLAPGEMRLYRGHVVATKLSPLGRVIAQLLRVIGGPLPLQNGATGTSVVSVIEDPDVGGQIWSRSYERAGRFPQVVHSAKRFNGPTGLEEYVGAGIGMSLKLSVEQRRLVFRSERYFFKYGWIAFRFPQWLTPGQMEIVHEQQADGMFSFRLTLSHPWFGQLLYQQADYRDV